MVKFLESLGMRFGPSVNAFTSFDETVYMLQVPTDKPEVLDKAFLILEDWAHNVSFDATEIDKERGVVIEEWRLRRGAGARMFDKQVPVLLKGSRYAERLPIGDVEIINSFKHDRLKKFYTDWYRPELMAVVAVGDFDKAAIEGLIKTHFGTIPASPATKLRPSYNVPDHPGTLYAITTDKEASSTSVTVYSKMPLRDPTTVGAYRQQMVERLFGGMLSTRFSEIAQKPDAPFLGASAGRGQFVRTKEVSTLSARVKDDGIERGLEALFVEAERVARFGFTAPELDRQKRNILRNFERAVAEKDNTESGDARRRVRAQLHRSGSDPRHRVRSGAPPAVPAGDHARRDQRAGEDTGSPTPTASSSSALPQKDSVKIPDEKALAAVIASAAGKESTAYVDTDDSKPLLAAPPSPGAITGTVTKDAFGDHRVAARQRRQGGAQADDVQGRRDSLPRLQPRRHVARGRQGLHPGLDGQPGHRQRRPRHVQRDRSAQDAHGQGRVASDRSSESSKKA